MKGTNGFDPCLRVLVVEDDEDSAESLRLLLEDEPFEISHATSLAQASACLDRESFDLFIIDAWLRDGSGVAFIEELRKRAEDVKVVLFTGDGLAGERSAADLVFIKGDDPTLLLKNVRSLLSEAGSRYRRMRSPGRLTGGDLVMVVEDDADTQEGMRDLLVQFGYRCVIVPNGRAALDHLRQEEHPLPCVILLDIRMPVMDGWTFLAEKQRDPAIAGIAVIVLTAQARAEDAAAKGVAYLAKPVDASILRNAIQSAC